jgi:hypothetical protein
MLKDIEVGQYLYEPNYFEASAFHKVTKVFKAVFYAKNLKTGEIKKHKKIYKFFYKIQKEQMDFYFFKKKLFVKANKLSAKIDMFSSTKEDILKLIEEIKADLTMEKD